MSKEFNFGPSFSGGGGGGGIGGNSGAVDNAALRADGIGGATLQSSDLVINDPAIGGLLPLDSAAGNIFQFLRALAIPNGVPGAPSFVFNAGGGTNFGAYYNSTFGAWIYEVNGEDRISLEFSSYRFRLSKDGEIVWSSTTVATDNPPDSGLKRSGPAALIVTDGSSSGKGWLQWAGEAYVTNDLTNATTILATTGLSITVQNGKKYAFKCIFYVSDSVAAEGVKVDFGGGTATATNFRAHVTGFDSALTINTQLTSLTGTATAGTFTGAGMIEVHGSFEPSSTGTFLPRFAQNSHAIGILTLFRGSHLLMWDIP